MVRGGNFRVYTEIQEKERCWLVVKGKERNGKGFKRKAKESRI